MRLSFLAVAAGVVSLSLAPVAARADLAGDSVNVTYAYPTSTSTFDNLGNFTVPGTGGIPNIASFVINPDSIDISSAVGENFNPSAFNGFEFTDLTAGFPGFAGATVDGSSSASVLGADVTFTSDEVFVNLAGLTVAANDLLIVDLSFTPAATSVTPEPASIALLGTGLLGVAGTMRRRFVRS